MQLQIVKRRRTTASGGLRVLSRWIALLLLVLGLACPCGVLAETPEDEQASDSDSPPQKEVPEEKTSAKAAPAHPEDGFQFGSYGRIQATTDFDGHSGQGVNVVSHGPRLLEGPYAELDFGYGMHHKDGFGVRIQITLALFEEFFHFTGDLDQRLALRNLYAEADGFLPYVKVWVGSRMYRGDDIYLFDFWPLDNLNTYGGGVRLSDDKSWEIKAQAGVNRLTNDYQLQTIDVPGRWFGSETVETLNRQRIIASAKATYMAQELVGSFSLKVSLYGEYHHLPSGTYTDEEAMQTEELPKDKGWLIGGEVGFWGFGKNTHLNLFVRYAEGLAAYGEWSSPWGLGTDNTTGGAHELVTGLSFNWESHWVGVMGAFYARKFKDADPNKYDLDDFWEGALAVRPIIFITDHFHQGFELGYQWRNSTGLSPVYKTHLTPQVTQLSIMEILSWDRGTYQRPQFRLVYTASYLNKGAKDVFPLKDVRRSKSWQHYLGVQVEWWFNSSYR